jgi:ubiquinone/menaquinone biosynthesis C-methylase UbiE
MFPSRRVFAKGSNMNAKSVSEYFYPEISVGGFSRVDGTIEFYQRINALIQPDHVILDIGAGRGSAHVDQPSLYRTRLMNFKGRVAQVIGLDVDSAVIGNPSLDQAHVMDGSAFPIADNSVNIAFADWVLEHISNPQTFADELYRVLQPDGWFCARTPNKWGYISIASRMIPEGLHSKVLKRVQPNRKTHDVFPTFYRLNTIQDLQAAFPASKWELVVYAQNSEPAYFGNNKLLWRLARLMFRFMPSSMGSVLMIYARKK